MRATNRLANQPLVPWCFVMVLLSMGTVDVKQWLPRRVQRQNITASLPAFKRHWLRDPFCRNLVRPFKLRSSVTPAQPEPWQTEWVWGEPSMSVSNTCGYNKSYNIVLPELLLCLPMKTSQMPQLRNDGTLREGLQDGKEEGKGYGKGKGKTMKGTGMKGAGKSGRFKGGRGEQNDRGYQGQCWSCGKIQVVGMSMGS